MTKMIQLIEEMDARLSQIADAENELVRALGHALSRVDQRLLQDVRKITTEHEFPARRYSARAAGPGHPDRRVSRRPPGDVGRRIR